MLLFIKKTTDWLKKITVFQILRLIEDWHKEFMRNFAVEIGHNYDKKLKLLL